VSNLPVRLRRQAHQDIRSVFEWIFEKSNHFQTAEKLALRLYGACDALGHFPMRGKARIDLMDGLRIMPFERMAVIAYRVHKREVEVLNIFYGGRDWEAIIVSEVEGDSEG
jgi:toxin ParE1/3/4